MTNLANPSDIALFWLSARGASTEAKLRQLARWLFPQEEGTRPYWQLVRSLQVLGHAEWDSDFKKLTAIPPYCIALSEERFLLCGARLPGWEAGLASAGLETEPQAPLQGPTRWICEQPPSPSQDLDFPVFADRSLEVLARLPNLSAAVRALPQTESPSAARWEQFTVRTNWQSHPGLLLRDGLYRSRDASHLDHYLLWDGQILRARTREEKTLVRWWQLLRLRKIEVHYDEARRHLGLPRWHRMQIPLVLERALCCASGSLPRPIHHGYRVYLDIDPSRALEVARILECNLEVHWKNRHS